ncbi:MAG: tRNA (N6-isopentenyl adenosine(37)-C2)-methylthiotransferase MiaB [Coriobacteriaceae bacterium]|nr:tRNA (N6-isopentenyl adenosine(37)-C2)-methylthiotransferase MiaB [Coriobacteriaceae bacterium]
MRTFVIRTFGCQMNKHDSERIAGLLRAQGMRAVGDAGDADVVVFMTCSVRENAVERIRGQVASLKALKTGGRPDLLIAVGGCVGQQEGEGLLRALPHVDVVFGTHNLAHLPALLESAARTRRPTVEVLDSSDTFASDLPSEREHPWHAWVPLMVGCDNFCSYCIVPYVRGRERSRPIGKVVAECERLAADGVVEVTLLGQNVNSYGRDLYGAPRFAEALRRVAATGVRRVRFATSHPKDLSPETIAAMAETPGVCPYLHLPVQSGSDDVLAAMNRHYTKDSYLALVERLYEAIPGLALSTDIIVGFPGETDDDFAETLDVVRRCRFDQAFTFIYSPREGTKAAALTCSVPGDVVHERFDRLVELVQASALEKNRAYVGTVRDVLWEGPSKRDESMLAGRTDTNKVVHAPCPAGHSPQSYAGSFCEVGIEAAQTWFLSGFLSGSLSGFLSGARRA